MKHIINLFIFFILIITMALADENETIKLKTREMNIIIIPSTLEVIENSYGKQKAVISFPQKEMKIKNLVSCSDSASWDIPSKNMSVSFKITGKKIKVKFLSNTEGNFTWPVAGSDCKAYILPLFEGSYVPSGDSRWLSFLTESSPVDTEEGLSMPFWGFLYGDHTLTYIIENPFNNEINFYDVSGSLAMSFKHKFTRNNIKKEYGFTIVTGSQSPVEPAKKYREYLKEKNYFLTMEEKIKAIPDVEKLVGAAHIYLWGDGVSANMLREFQKNGFNRLWLGLDSWHDGLNNPDFVKKAMKMGYLVGPYDSYNSIHDPNDPGWETAVFDKELYEKGVITDEQGKKKAGFMGKGYLLSPLVTLPYVKKRVSGIMEQLRFNSWFIDCDGYGQLYDDYSPLHGGTKEDDMHARCERMAWIRDTYKIVIGSEKGAWYSAPVIHFAHGMTTPVFGWGDPDMTDKNSEYFPGRWWPPEGPEVFMKQVPLKEKYSYIYYDPRFRLPLYETVFHDSIITTHHWQYHSLKFKDQIETLELLELLYSVPPIYHLNLKEFEKHRDRILKHYRFFSNLHKKTALLSMSDFFYLTEDRMMQKTVFSDNKLKNKIEIIANFYNSARTYDNITIPAYSVCVRFNETEDIYKP